MSVATSSAIASASVMASSSGRARPAAHASSNAGVGKAARVSAVMRSAWSQLSQRRIPTVARAAAIAPEQPRRPFRLAACQGYARQPRECAKERMCMMQLPGNRDGLREHARREAKIVLKQRSVAAQIDDKHHQPRGIRRRESC